LDSSSLNVANILRSIVEYATREQAQQAVNTLSNQNLMGRLVYVREVCYLFSHFPLLMSLIFVKQDREAEPRFTGPPAAGRGGYEGPPGRGGFGGGGFGGGMGAGGGGGGRQIYVSNVCYILFLPLMVSLGASMLIVISSSPIL
jgi:hypothetical protein